jgi:hypothetical protein
MHGQKEVSIDGDEYAISLFPAGQGLKLLSKLTGLLGGPLAKLAEGPEAEGAEDSGQLLGAAMASLCENLEKTDVVALVKELLSVVQVNGQKLPFDTHFAGKYGPLLKVVKEVVEHNYSDFFGALRNAVAGLNTKAVSHKGAAQPLHRKASLGTTG